MRSACYLFFETLATKLKTDIIVILSEKPSSVSALSKRLRQERSKGSHALLSMQECGFVSAKKKGREIVYSLNSKTMKPLLRLIDRHVQEYCKICKK